MCFFLCFTGSLRFFEPARGKRESLDCSDCLSTERLTERHTCRVAAFYLGTDIDPLHDTLLGHTDLEQEIGSEDEPAAPGKGVRRTP